MSGFSFRYKCPYCGEYLEANDPVALAKAVLNHVFKKHHTTGEYVCPACHKRFSSTNEFIEHMKREHDVEKSVYGFSLMCLEVARRGFGRKRSLKMKCVEKLALRIYYINGDENEVKDKV